MAAASMVLLTAQEVPLAAAAMAAFVWQPVMDTDGAHCTCVAAAPQRLRAALQRPEVVLAAERQHPGAAAAACVYYGRAGLPDATRMAAGALPALRQSLASVDLAGMAAMMTGAALKLASDAPGQPTSAKAQLLHCECLLMAKLATDRRCRQWAESEVDCLGITFRMCTPVVDCLLASLPATAITAAAAEALHASAAEASSAAQRTAQQTNTHLYWSFDPFLPPCLAAASAPEQQAFHAAATAVLRQTLQRASTGTYQMPGALESLPAAAAAVSHSTSAPALAQQATADPAETRRLIAAALPAVAAEPSRCGTAGVTLPCHPRLRALQQHSRPLAACPGFGGALSCSHPAAVCSPQRRRRRQRRSQQPTGNGMRGGSCAIAGNSTQQPAHPGAVAQPVGWRQHQCNTAACQGSLQRLRGLPAAVQFCSGRWSRSV